MQLKYYFQGPNVTIIHMWIKFNNAISKNEHKLKKILWKNKTKTSIKQQIIYEPVGRVEKDYIFLLKLMREVLTYFFIGRNKMEVN